MSRSLQFVAVFLFFISSSSVSSHQHYVSDDCSSVTQSPCNPLSVYAGDMSQYNNSIFYFIGTSYINNSTFTMISLENISLHGLGQSSGINCTMVYNGYGILTINSSNRVNFSNISFQHCNIVFESSSNFTITGSFLKNSGLTLKNLLDTRIESSIFDNVYASIYYNPPSVCYNELHHYSLVLTNLTKTGNYPLYLQLSHGTSYNLSVTINNVSMKGSEQGIHLYLVESLFSLYITNSSVSHSQAGFSSTFSPQKMQSKKCCMTGIQSQSTVLLKDCQFYNNSFGLYVKGHSGFSSHHIIIKSCSIRNSTNKGLYIDGHLSTSTQISISDTELIGSTAGNEITKCVFIHLNNVTFAKSLSTGLLLKESVVTVEEGLAFKNNTGAVGGGLAINGSSVVVLSSSANLEFINNHASYKGGGIYIDDGADFLFASNTFVPLTLKYNTARVAGYDIYGIIFSFNQFNLTNPKVNTSTIARKVSFCNPDDNGAQSIGKQHIFPGQPLKYNVALFGHNYHTDLYDSPTDGTVIVEIDGEVMNHTYITSKCSLIEYTPNQLSYTEHEIIIDINWPAYSYPRIHSYFIFNECPIGFDTKSSQGVCTCSQSVSRENVTCDIHSLSITRNGLLWIGTYDTSTSFNANTTNPNACIINEDCLLYCSPNPVTFQLNNTDTQCVYNRGQRMCGSCREGYSLLMGSNKCGQCHDDYVVVAWIALFAVMGILLVILLIALNLTVSVGTLNGLLFYANIVKLYEPVFSRKGALPVLSQVISWINLDFGFEICFYNGMDNYAKQWLQFAFPLYLWIIIIIIIQLCRKYGKLSRLMGSNVVPVLSTLTFLSYTKLVRTIVIVLHKHEVTLHCTNESVRSVSLWYEDPNVEYAKGRHAGLFGFALLVSVFFVMPYTLFLLCHTVLEKHLSHFKLFKSWSRFKPIIDAYSGPMKDDYRFWPGLLLITRIPMLITVTFLKDESRVLLLAVAAFILSLSFIFGGVYRKKLNNITEFWFLLNLSMIASLSIAFTDDSQVLIWYNTCLSVFIASCILIVVYHLYLQLSHMKCYDALIKKFFKEQGEDDDSLLDVTESHLTVDQQRREIVPSSTDYIRRRESVIDLY